MNILNEVLKAEWRIRPHVLQTPLLPSHYLSRLSGSGVHLKMESEQYTNSFKFRGSINKILSLTSREKAKGVISASTGNHARGLARALSITGGKGTIFLPENAELSKIEALKEYRIKLAFRGKNSLEAELHAKKVAREKGAVWVSPYNDPQVIGGQGTIGIELTKQIAKIDHVFATIGGGGLVSGIATYLKAVSPGTQIIGCLPENSPEMYLSVQKGEIVRIEPKETLSDGSAGGIEPGSITFPICQALVDDYVLVSEEEIKEALRLIIDRHQKMIEGAAAVAVAGYLKTLSQYRGGNVIIVICGGNISAAKLKEILS